jgi:hypothetical protein
MVGCPLNSDLEPWHTATSVPPNLARIDSYYLNYLVKNGVQREEKKQCTYVGHATSRRTVCGEYKSRMCTAYIKYIQDSTTRSVREQSKYKNVKSSLTYTCLRINIDIRILCWLYEEHILIIHLILQRCLARLQMRLSKQLKNILQRVSRTYVQHKLSL